MNSARPTSTSSQEQHNSYINMHWNSKWKEIALCTTCCRLFHQMVNTPSFKMVQTWPLWNLPISFKSRPLPPRRAWRSVDSNVCQSKPSTRECSSAHGDDGTEYGRGTHPLQAAQSAFHSTKEPMRGVRLVKECTQGAFNHRCQPACKETVWKTN